MHLLSNFKVDPNFQAKDLEHCNKHFEMAITPAHFLANLLNPRFRRNILNQEQLDSAMGFVDSFYSTVKAEVIHYRAKSAPSRTVCVQDMLSRMLNLLNGG